jgi:hypothetical protein
MEAELIRFLKPCHPLEHFKLICSRRPMAGIARCAKRAVAIQLDCLPAFGGAEGDQGFVAALLAMTSLGYSIF